MITKAIIITILVAAVLLYLAVKHENKRHSSKEILTPGDYIIKVKNSVKCKVIKQVGKIVHYEVCKTGARGSMNRSEFVYMRKQF
jgi:hypothetical protein